MDFFYDKHDKQYKEYKHDKEKSKIAKSWLDQQSLDYWRHNRMLKLIRPLIQKNEKWLTIGDGRYGSEAAWLKKNGVNCHSSDMHTNLLEDAHKNGLIDSYSKQNAENLDFEANSFDYVLIKETLHHLPRPWLAIYESFRVCKKGVIIIEPNDPYPYSNVLRISFINIKNLLKRFLGKKVYKDEYSFEEVGNFIYTINFRELEKFLLGIHKTDIASTNLNDHHFKNIEFVSIKGRTIIEKLICMKLKTIIFFKDILSNLSLLNFSIGEVILFKEKPSSEIIDKLKKSNWEYKELPVNPYL
tara:strand:- start:944 stop:1843 length:900 start_codon:yes stop_codon:yes gene_type:complete